MANILVIEPSRGIRNNLKERLEYEGYRVETAEDTVSGAALLAREVFDLILCGQQSGHLRTSTPWIAMSDDGSLSNAVHAMQQGACDFLTKPIDMNRLLEAVRRCVEDKDKLPQDESPSPEPQRAPRRRSGHVEEIIGDSRQIIHVKRLIDKVAPSEARVLITGANGTGKELVARWLHEKSHRCGAPFVEVNCAAIPSELIESELFGHEKGAFTSAIKQRKGKFEQAIGGTLFLDEIGDMSLSAQAKVLRALQENKISRVGSDRDIEVDVRVIAATNKNLNEEISKGNFREDLYHRISVIVINVPPLAQRREDIPPLVDYFVDKISAEYEIAPKKIEPQAVDELRNLPWTGNIRELRNVIERLIILSGDEITVDDVKTYAMGLV